MTLLKVGESTNCNLCQFYKLFIMSVLTQFYGGGGSGGGGFVTSAGAYDYYYSEPVDQSTPTIFAENFEDRISTVLGRYEQQTPTQTGVDWTNDDYTRLSFNRGIRTDALTYKFSSFEIIDNVVLMFKFIAHNGGYVEFRDTKEINGLSVRSKGPKGNNNLTVDCTGCPNLSVVNNFRFLYQPDDTTQTTKTPGEFVVVDFSGCSLDQTSVDHILVSLSETVPLFVFNNSNPGSPTPRGSGNFPSKVEIKLNGGSNASPSATGLAAKAIILAEFNTATVSHN